MGSSEETVRIYERPMREGFGFVLRPFVERFFSPIRFSPEQEARLQSLSREGHIVYVMYASSVLQYLFVNFWCLRLRIPLADYGNGIPAFQCFQPFRRIVKLLYTKIRVLLGDDAYDRGLPVSDLIENTLNSGRGIVLFLRHSRIFRKRTFTKPGIIIKALLDYQRKSAAPVFLIPMEILWRKMPVKVERGFLDIMLGDKEAPGFVRQVLMLLRYSRQSIATMGKVMNLKAFQQENAHVEEDLLRKKIRWSLHRDMTVAEQQITGPRLKPRKYVIGSIMSSMRLRGLAREIAPAEGRTFEQVMKRAERYAREIASDYNTTYVALFDIVLTWVWNNIYNGLVVDKAGIAEVKKASRKGSLILLPSHKSHIDYLLLSYVFYYHDLPPPHIAAGVNLSFWPMGHIFRKAGAFFIRRTFRGQPLYSAVFRTYIRWLMQEGYVQEFFLEGTRSRTGKLMYPKLGMLSMELDAFCEGVAHDVHLVPISINYEKVVEESSYSKESGGAKKRGESIGSLLSAPRFLRKKYGRVHIQFGSPISVREYLQDRQIDLAGLAAKGRMGVVQDLALRTCHAINQVTTVTPSALAATVLLNHAGRSISQSDLHGRAAFLFSLLQDLGARVSVNLQNLLWSVQEALEVFVADKAIQRSDGPDGTLYAIEDTRRVHVNFYKNNIVHYFVPLAIGATVFRLKRASHLAETDFHEGMDFFMRLFQWEFIFPPDNPMGRCCAVFDEVLADRHRFVAKNDQGSIEVLDADSMDYIGRLLANFIESYYLVCFTAERILRDRRLEEREFLRRAIETSDRPYRQGDISHLESVSVFVFRNAVRSLVSMGFLLRMEQKSGAFLALTPKGRQELGALGQTLYGLLSHGDIRRDLEPGDQC